MENCDCIEFKWKLVNWNWDLWYLKLKKYIQSNCSITWRFGVSIWSWKGSIKRLCNDTDHHLSRWLITVGPICLLFLLRYEFMIHPFWPTMQMQTNQINTKKKLTSILDNRPRNWYEFTKLRSNKTWIIIWLSVGDVNNIKTWKKM